MDRNEFINFCIYNFIIIISIYTIFIIVFVAWISTKITKISIVFNKVMIDSQNISKDYNNTLHQNAYAIKKENDKILANMRILEKILDKYKGKTFDTQLNMKIKDEISNNLHNINYDENIENDYDFYNFKNYKNKVDNNKIKKDEDSKNSDDKINHNYDTHIENTTTIIRDEYYDDDNNNDKPPFIEKNKNTDITNKLKKIILNKLAAENVSSNKKEDIHTMKELNTKNFKPIFNMPKQNTYYENELYGKVQEYKNKGG